MNDKKLIFIYNADGGLINQMIDAGHKLLSPATYPCSLCAITYGAVSMRRGWKAYLQALNMPVMFFHRDDIRTIWPDCAVELPAIALQSGSAAPCVIIGAAELNRISDLAELILLLDRRLIELPDLS